MSQATNIVEASVDELSSALESGALTSVELLAKYLLRISNYDCRQTMLNSIPLLNQSAFDEAAAADDRRAKGTTRGPLDGIPFTVKDSYKVKGMTMACGSEAFVDLTVNEDAFAVSALREAGAVLVGKTNMCPMAYGGMLRGVYGRAENPYNPDYLAAAFGSGSSNGSGVSTASSFAAFGLGSETVSSGRSPASNNSLIAYTPSKGLFSCRGIWPLYPTCDVIVPHTRSMDDLLVLLNTIKAKDHETTGDFWRDQPFVKIPTLESIVPQSFLCIKDRDHLKGKRIAVPRMYVTQSDNGPYVSASVEPLWQQARADLEAAGATIEIVEEFPALQAYEQPSLQQEKETSSPPRLPENWNATERGQLIAHAWEDFLQTNDSSHISSLSDVPPEKMFPHMQPSDPQVKFTEPANAVHWSKLASYVTDRAPPSREGKSAIYDVPRLEEAVKALEDMRKHYFEDWLSKHNYDYVAFPAVGDVARADADVDEGSAEHSWANGVKYSHGNRMLRHLGIPSVTVPMGMLESYDVPMGLTLLGRAYDDAGIMQAAYAFEQRSQHRVAPHLTLPLSSDEIAKGQGETRERRPKLTVAKWSATAAESEDFINVSVEGSMGVLDDSDKQNRDWKPHVEIFIDGVAVKKSNVQIQPPREGASASSNFSCECLAARPPIPDRRNTVVGKIARDSTMVMVLARNGDQGQPSGYLRLFHGSEM